ncbi:Flavin monooxygenase-like [Dillenia turbinata]|uniref:Flavin-containing monooxygenase n=1 Tax=Dillenia turbinata TaxID=194707 RepID=A0AAN8UW88_9MAGN
MGSVKVAVIGAGMAGLVAARELQREGHNVVVFEKSDKVGGTWAYDPRVETDLLGLDPDRERVHSSLYASLRTNLPRQVLGFLDYPFLTREGGDLRNYPGHEEVLWFLTTFAEYFGLVELIRFGCNVVRVEQVEGSPDEWIVEWCTSGCDHMEVFEAVVVCTGRYSEPKIAEFPGINLWPGLQMHSHNYRTPEPFRDKIVVIIGAAASALDISKDVSTVTKEVHLASRTPNVEFAKLESRNNTWQHSMIKCAHEDGKVEFHDGSFTYADTIIHCTGYHYPFLKTNGIVNVDDNRVWPLYRHIFPPCLAPRLSFVGVPYRSILSLIAELQSKWVAKVLSGKLLLPSKEEMTTSVQQLY